MTLTTQDRIADDRPATSEDRSPAGRGGVLTRISETVRKVSLPDRSAERAARRADRELRRLQGRPTARRIPLFALASLLRTSTFVIVATLVLSTIFLVIPMLGGWITAVVGQMPTSLGLDAFIATWIAPFAFAVTLLTVAEIVLIRRLWRGGSTLIGRWRAARAEIEQELAATQTAAARRGSPTTKTTHRKTKSKGSK